jgi:hypothetical protein
MYNIVIDGFFLIATSYHSKATTGQLGPGTPVGTRPLWYQFIRKIVQTKIQ